MACVWYCGVLVYIAAQCNVRQVKTDPGLLPIKDEPGTPTFDEDSMSSMDAQTVKVCITA